MHETAIQLLCREGIFHGKTHVIAAGIEVRAAHFPRGSSSPERRHFATAIIDLLHEKFYPEAKQLITLFEPENDQIFVDEDPLQYFGLTLRDLAHFLESAVPFCGVRKR